MSEKITQGDNLRQAAYINPDNLLSRKALYEFTTPKYNVEEEALKGLRIKGQESILDVGCGNGRFLIGLRSVRNHQGRLCGIDIAPGILDGAMVTSNEQKLDIDFKLGDAQTIPFPDNTFDIVTSFHMIYHVPSISKALQEMNRVLKPEGQFALSANSKYSKIEILQRLKKAVCKRFGLPFFPDTTARFNIEAGLEKIRKYFREVKLTTYSSTILVYDVIPYLNYFNTLRSFWEEDFSDAQWSEIMSFAKKNLQKTLSEKGRLEEANIFGIFHGRKK